MNILMLCKILLVALIVALYSYIAYICLYSIGDSTPRDLPVLYVLITVFLVGFPFMMKDDCPI